MCALYPPLAKGLFPSPFCYHFYFVSFTIARTNTLNEFELNDFCCRKAASCSTYSFMCIHVTYYYHYYIQNGRVVISTKQFYVWWYLHLWYLSHWQAELSFSSLALSLSGLWMCQTHLYMCLIFIVLCLRACMFGVSLLRASRQLTTMSMCRRKITLLNAHPRTFLFTKSYFFASDDLFVLCAIICHSLDIMVSQTYTCMHA